MIPLIAAAQSPTTDLKLKTPVDREIKSGDTQSYTISLASGQYAHITVNQLRIDVVVVLLTPEGKELTKAENLNGAPLSLIAETAGSYRIDLRGTTKEPVTGSYRIELKEVHNATPQDITRVAAERGFIEAERLRLERTPQSTQKSIEKYEETLKLYESLGDREWQTNIALNLSLIFFSQNEFPKAIDFAYRTLEFYRASGDRGSEAVALQRIGQAYRALGEMQKALEYLNQALPLFRTASNRSGEGINLGTLGQVYNTLGERQKALDFLNQALQLQREMHNRREEATTLNNIAFVYNRLGDRTTALDYYTKSLEIRRSLKDVAAEAAVLNNIGSIQAFLGDMQKSLEYYNQALPLWKTLADRVGQANTLNNIGWNYDFLHDEQKALDYYGQALTLYQSAGDRSGQAYALTNIGRAYSAKGHAKEGLEFLNQALPLRRAVGDRNGETLTLYYLARARRDLGLITEALADIDAALKIVETIRGNVASAGLRASFLASTRDYYQLRIDLLMLLHNQHPTEGFDALALQTLEQSHARSLLDNLAEAQADIRQGVDPALLDRERSLQQLLNAKADRQARLLAVKHTDEQADDLAKEINSIATDYDQVESRIRVQSPAYAGLTQPQPIDLKTMQKSVLDRDTLLLAYSLGAERSYLWVVSTSSIKSYELPKRENIEAAARRWYESLKNNSFEKELTDGAVELGKLLFASAASQFGSKRLLIVPDGILIYIPFAALASPAASAYEPLISRNEIVVVPSASTLALLRQESAGRKPAAKAVAILADPVFRNDDPRVTSAANATPAKIETNKDLTRSAAESGGANFARLIGTRREAAAILNLAPKTGTLEELDFDASKKVATSAELGQYRIIHFATHGLLNSVHPELSGIVLSLVNQKGETQDGFLRLNEIYDLKLPADLIVLSACQTALGKDVKGEGLIGLTRGFMYAGAPRNI
jgi:CHAT domain-containing protein